MMGTKEAVQDACRSFKAGDVVLCCEPLVWALERSAYETRCAYCLLENQELRTCSGCKLHRYCSVACQAADWKLEHNLECAVLKTAPVGNTKMARDSSMPYKLDVPREFVAKLVNKIKLNPMMDIPEVGRKSFSDLLLKLPTNPAQSEIERQLLPGVSAWDPESILTGVPAEVFVACYATLRYSALNMYDVLGTACGVAVYPQAPPRRMTRVCWDINVELNRQGRRLVIHAAEDIPQYTGLRDLRYSDLQEPFCRTRAERRAVFQERYGYLCTCRRCTPEYDAEINRLRCVTVGCMNQIPSDSRALQACSECGALNGDRLQQFRRFIQQFETNTTRYSLELQDVLAMQLCQEMDAAGILQPDAHFRYVCGWELPKKYFADNRFEDGWKMTKELVDCVRKIYPKYAVFRARLLLSAGLTAVDALHHQMLISGMDHTSRPADRKLEASANEVVAVNMDYCSEARSIFVKIFGEQSKVVQKCDADCKQADRKLLHIQQILRTTK
ncbi:uncharacterized protein LOC129596093 [Paramacrobiotus metropolitanus]|uniref:uncharacterized protein LOC129596093 n=1 Tax=Paramacrobiotus metropolitanus TaxID=2943436 RepID=UPI0024459AF6|nr:uncharacterized protein LOC129596093 [Paramacrobiotus metropolitanus]